VTLLVVSPDYASHLMPLLALAAPRAQAGERVVVATGPAVSGRVREAGFEWAPLVLGRGSNPGVAQARDQPPGEDENLAAFFEATRRGMVATLRLQAELRRNDLLWRPAETARRTIEVVEAVAADAVVVDHLAFGATLGLRAAAVPYVDVVLGHPSALPLAGERYGVPPSWPACLRPDPAGLAGLERLADEVARGFTDEFNRAVREVNPIAAGVDDAFAAHGDLVLYSYPAALHDPGRVARLPAVHAFLGSLVRDEAADAGTGEWLEREPERPLVVVSFGTFLSARADVLARVAAALRELDVRVALATGSADPASLGRLPGGWLVRPFLPQVALVRRAALAITHAGNNGVTEALSAGVPLLVLPFSTDQFAVAADLERTGLGLAADPNAVGVEAIRAAAVALLGEPYRSAAAALGRELRADPGPARALRAMAGRWGAAHVCSSGS
jgi:UDP:flavonoid glycosyltransferase YjiC (YdhE family)